MARGGGRPLHDFIPGAASLKMADSLQTTDPRSHHRSPGVGVSATWLKEEKGVWRRSNGKKAHVGVIGKEIN